ncbi:hypothetical protein FCM35_KLT14206 [Carex littledalei]|uniref:Uncharacterized protein n=1 Tax=Carex littledalei TaxID=544730 RepID=A0A833VDW3_9POAL|nr:hypothetical protein FCM35_KLT14206 [Carex littledalei]
MLRSHLTLTLTLTFLLLLLFNSFLFATSQQEEFFYNVPKVATPEQLRDYEKKSNVGFDAFVQAYPSSSFDKDSNWSTATTTTGSKGERSEVDVGPNGYNPVPQFLRRSM